MFMKAIHDFAYTKWGIVATGSNIIGILVLHKVKRGFATTDLQKERTKKKVLYCNIGLDKKSAITVCILNIANYFYVCMLCDLLLLLLLSRIPKTCSDRKRSSLSSTSTDSQRTNNTVTGLGRSLKPSEIPPNCKRAATRPCLPFTSLSSTRTGWKASSWQRHSNTCSYYSGTMTPFCRSTSGFLTPRHTLFPSGK